jgi:hypothetical protein
VTNTLNFLPQTDQIILLENGSVCEIGTYEKLSDTNATFKEFMREFLKSVEFNAQSGGNPEKPGQKEEEKKKR